MGGRGRCAGPGRRRARRGRPERAPAGTGIGSFVIAARRVDGRVAQHLAFIDALRAAGVAVTALDSRALEHADLTTVIGAPGDTLVTPELMAFLDGCVRP